ncbi:MAG: hypothetical protein ABEJ65_11170 [bacterium]
MSKGPKEVDMDELLEKQPESARHTHFVLKKSESPVLHVARIQINDTCFMVCYDFGLVASGPIEDKQAINHRLNNQIIDHILFHYSQNRMEELFDTGFDIGSDSPWHNFVDVNRRNTVEMWEKFLEEIASNVVHFDSGPASVSLSEEQIEDIKTALSFSAVEENVA